MNIRPKTVRRLLILFTGVMLFAGVIAMWLALSQHQLHARIAQERRDAITAYNARDYAAAVVLFRGYLDRSHTQDTDYEAVFDYGKSRMNTPMEGNRHIFEAIGLFERYLQLSHAADPRGFQRRTDEETEARHLLLKLYVQAHYTKEGGNLATVLLATNPNDIEALGDLVRSLQADSNAAAALPRCRELNQLVPDDLEWQTAELNLMSATGQSAQQILAHALDLRKQHPDDPVFEALASLADLAYGNDPAGARQAIESAAKRPPGTPDTVLRIVRLLDIQQDSPLADDLLNRALAAHPGDVPLLRTVVARTWERQRPADALEKLTSLDPRTADAELIGYKSMAQYESGQSADAALLVSALAARKDNTSQAWASALRTGYSQDRPAPAIAIGNYREAMLREPSNPVFPMMLGQACAAVGEVDQAMRAWTEAGQRSPSWALPYCLISRALSTAGRYPEALRAAELARQRSPGMQMVESSYAKAWYGLEFSAPGAPDPKETDALFSLLENIQKAWKNEPGTLPEYVSMLARRGQRDRAADKLRGALISDPAPQTETLVELSAVSQREHLGLEQQLLDRADTAHGPTPAVALARAGFLLDTGKHREALDSFDQAGRTHASDIAWQLAAARLHDAALESDAAERWSVLGNAHPDDLQIQFAILQSLSRRSDRALWRRTIDRVKALTGADAQLWQLEDARWRLAGQPGESDLAAVIASLQKLTAASRSSPEPRRLLAEALIRTAAPDSASRAVIELTAAHDLQPGDFDTTATLTQLLISQGMRDRATVVVDSVAGDPNLSRQRRLWAAEMDAQIGRIEPAIALLTAGDDARAPDPARDALLARLYRQAGRIVDAADEYLKIVDDPAAAPDALAAGAEFFTTRKQPDIADRFLNRLAREPLKAGALDVLRADLQQLSGEPDQAIATLVAASKSNPRIEQVWQELSGAYLRSGKLDDADRAAADGLKMIPASGTLTAMRRQIARVRSLTPQDIGALLEIVSHDPRQPVADQVLTLLSDAKSRSAPPEQVLASLRELADHHPAFVPLELLLAQRYAAAGHLKDAAEIAARASSAAPQDIDPVRLLCAVQTAAGNWDAARQAARRWRQLAVASGATPLDADLSIARSEIRQSRPEPAAAVAQLAPYLAAGVPDASRQAALPLYCSALIGAGRTQDAQMLLQPLLATSPHWRLVWLELASSAHRNAASAVEWLGKFSQIVAVNTQQDRLALADAWEQVANRFDSAAAHDAARALLAPIVAGPNVPPQAWPSWASLNQAAGNLPETERAWREYLKASPGQPLAKNNLAYILMLEGSVAQLAEGEQLSRAAIAAEPGVSTLYDTLARIQLRTGKTDDALKSFRTALDHNPANVDAMIGLADVLQSRPQNREEAKSLVDRIDAAMRDGAPIATPLRKQFDRVKNAMISSSQ